ncbi:hypothetical protein LCGC14_0217430 [marine sediment metagenome]|uniref:Uncharacterized protein n=1 Tax=marine sediment metagenome TaxID=412755 RepID=A0A0F9UIY9_9ZZZZ
MAPMTDARGALFADIWQSYRSLPGWVQIWVGVWLAPINMVSLFFLSEPRGLWIALLANIAMLLNLPVILHDRGFSKLMALPHLLPWTLLVLLLILARPQAVGVYDAYLWVLLATNVVSLVFDYPDAIKWLKGDRKAARR